MEQSLNRLDTFLSQLKETNFTLDAYSDFGKISQRVAEVSISLNMLNYLLNKSDLRAAVEALWRRDKHVFEVMDILIATRRTARKTFLDRHHRVRTVHSLFERVEGVMEFLEGTGLAQLFREGKIKDLNDYVFGVETGLDSHARKNRSGQITENLVARILTAGGVQFRRQVSSAEFPAVAAALGFDRKVFDFMIKTHRTTYLMEVNFYNQGGSKPSEVSRAYSEIAKKMNALAGYEFVWLTDGMGWKQAENNLEEAIRTIPNLYNLSTFERFVERVKAEA